jgi:hypothetical protein
MRIATAAACLAAIAMPGAAMAQRCTPQQTVAALDQYCDALPTSDGQFAPIGSSRAVGPPLAQALPASDAAELRESGTAGQALLLLSAAAPIGTAVPSPTRRRAARRAAAEVRESDELEGRRGPVRTVASAIASASADAVAASFKWGLLISTLGLAGVAWVRFRAGTKA